MSFLPLTLLVATTRDTRRTPNGSPRHGRDFAGGGLCGLRGDVGPDAVGAGVERHLQVCMCC